MKSTGIVRRVDELGRIVIPMELRRTFNIDVRDPLEIFIDEDKIVLSKHNQTCVFCGGTENMQIFKEKNICRSCHNSLTNS